MDMITSGPKGCGMTATATRYLHLVRHGEATPDESALTENGRRQATLLGRRLRGIPFAAIHHGPLPRAEETARLIGDELEGVPLHRSSLAGDYVPHVPHRDELPPESADLFLRFLARPVRKNGSTAPPWPAGRWTGSPARSTANRTGTNWSSPTTSWSPGSSGTPCTPPSGAGSASTTPTRP